MSARDMIGLLREYAGIDGGGGASRRTSNKININSEDGDRMSAEWWNWSAKVNAPDKINVNSGDTEEFSWSLTNPNKKSNRNIASGVVYIGKESLTQAIDYQTLMTLATGGGLPSQNFYVLDRGSEMKSESSDTYNFRSSDFGKGGQFDTVGGYVYFGVLSWGKGEETWASDLDEKRIPVYSKKQKGSSDVSTREADSGNISTGEVVIKKADLVNPQPGQLVSKTRPVNLRADVTLENGTGRNQTTTVVLEVAGSKISTWDVNVPSGKQKTIKLKYDLGSRNSANTPLETGRNKVRVWLQRHNTRFRRGGVKHSPTYVGEFEIRKDQVASPGDVRTAPNEPEGKTEERIRPGQERGGQAQEHPEYNTTAPPPGSIGRKARELIHDEGGQEKFFEQGGEIFKGDKGKLKISPPDTSKVLDAGAEPLVKPVDVNSGVNRPTGSSGTQRTERRGGSGTQRTQRRGGGSRTQRTQRRGGGSRTQRTQRRGSGSRTQRTQRRGGGRRKPKGKGEFILGLSKTEAGIVGAGTLAGVGILASKLRK